MKCCLASLLITLACANAFGQFLPDSDLVPPPPASFPVAVTEDLQTAEQAFSPSPAAQNRLPVIEAGHRETRAGRFAGCCESSAISSGYQFTWAPDKWAKVGAAVRTSLNSQTYPSPGIGGNYFTINNARLLTSGQVTEHLGFELNSDVALAQTVTPEALTVPPSFDLLDAIVKVETGELFNIWAGTFLPPSDRANISGPFFINGWDYPFVSNYPAIFQGRQTGAAYWGQWEGGRVKWSVGVFDGTGATLQPPYTDPPDRPPNPDNNLQVDARVTMNFLDPEPGYYHQSSYYGDKDILALGFAIQTQQDALGTAAAPADFTGLNLDLLFEKKLANGGVFTLDGAVYKFNNDNLPTSSQQGQSGMIFVGYMIPQDLTLGPVTGRLRPFTRYQKYDRDFPMASAGLYSQATDVGVEYVIHGPNARVTAVWSQRDVIAVGQIQLFTLGAQLIF